MKKLTLTMFTTLDGFIADADNSTKWVRGDDEDFRAYELATVSNADTLLLGGTTYRDFASVWPDAPENPKSSEWTKTYARKLNALRKVVVSKSLEEARWNDTTLLRSIVPKEIEKLKDGSKKGIVIYGSSSVVQQLTPLGLIDEYQLLVHPTVLGGGKPLFRERVDLELVKEERFKSGVILLTYQLAAKK